MTIKTDKKQMKNLVYILMALMAVCVSCNEDAVSKVEANDPQSDSDSVLSEYRYVIVDSLGNEHYVDSATFEANCREVSKTDPMLRKLDSALLRRAQRCSDSLAVLYD